MSDLDATAWAQIRRLYETSDLSVGEIARRHGTTTQCIYYRRRIEAWPKRSVMTPTMIAAAQARYRDNDARSGVVRDETSVDTSAGTPVRYGSGARYGVPAGGAALPDDKATLARFKRVIEIALAKMETSMETQKPEESTPTEQERSARTVGALVRSFEKVTEINAGNDDTSATSEIDRTATAELRRELAERIYRMWGRPKR